MNTNWFEKLFINEAKPALDRHAGGGGGNSLGVPAIEVATADEMDAILANSTVSDTGTVYYYTGESTDKYAQGSHYVLIGEAKLQDKEVTQNGEVTPDEGYDGLGKVSVKTESSLKKIWDISKSTYQFFRNSCSIITDATGIINYNDTENVTNVAQMFNECGNLTTVPLFDTAKVTDMNNMFAYCKKLSSVPFFNTENVINMRQMCNKCKTITTVPLFNTKKVTDFKGMFYECDNLLVIPALDVRSSTTLSDFVYLCSNVSEIWIKNIRITIHLSNSTSYGNLLTIDSLLNILNETVYTTSAKTLTLGTGNLAKFTGEYEYVKKTGKYLDLDDNETTELVDGQTKIPVVWCSSTDEGAMKVADYMTEKGWALA